MKNIIKSLTGILKSLFVGSVQKIPNNKFGETIKTHDGRIVERFPQENTPFDIIKFDNKYMVYMGKYRLSEPMETYEQAVEDIKDTSWIRIMQIMQAMIEEHEYGKEVKQNGQVKDPNQLGLELKKQ